MNDRLWLDPDISLRLCLTLLHSLWIAALLAALARLIDRIWMRSVEKRYVVHVAALLAALVALPVTYALVGPEPETLARVDLTPVVTPVFEPVTVEPLHASATPAIGVASDLPATSSDAFERDISASIAAPVSGRADWQYAATMFVGLYVLGVLVMLGRLARGLISAQRTAAGALPILSGAVVDTLVALARRWNMRVVPAVAVAQRIVVPQVVGLLRPMILLPASSLSGLTVDELQMILAHELAHVRRHDLWINLAQRLAEVALFFNPALWYLTRRVSLLREFCCDELTCRSLPAAEPAPRTRYAATLLRVAELSRPPHIAASELAALAAAGRSPSELRRRIAHLFGEPIREPLRLSRGGMLTLAAGLTLAFCIPVLWPSRSDSAVGALPETSQTTAPDAAASPPQADSAADKFDNGVMEISGVCTTAAGEPIANAEVRLYLVNSPFLKETLVRTVHTGKDGHYQFADVPYPSVAQRGRSSQPYAVAIKAAGHGSTVRSIPITFGRQVTINLSLKDAATVQGAVTGADSKPIAGADVWIYGIGPGPLDGILSAKTDAEGRFEITDADVFKSGDLLNPNGRIRINSFYLRARHPDYGTRMKEFTSAPSDVNLTLDPGGVIEGRVVNAETGEPAGAVLVRAMSQNGLPIGSEYFTTDEQGRYRVVLPASTYNLWVHHDNLTAHALEGLAITSGATLTAPDLRLIKGGLVEGQLIDADSGEPMQLLDGDIADIQISGPTRPDSSSAVQSEAINPDGSFRFRLPPGQSKLRLPSTTYGTFERDGAVDTLFPTIVEGETVNLRLKVRRVKRPDRRTADVAAVGATRQEAAATAANPQPTKTSEDQPPAGQPTFVTVDISGRALDEQGQPIANARIHALSTTVEMSIKAEVTTDADGRYRMEQVKLPVQKASDNDGHDMATFELFGFAESHAVAFRPFKVVFPDAKHLKDYDDPFLGDDDPPSRFGIADPINLDLRFGAPHTIRGRLVDDRGQPIAGAGVRIRAGEIERNGRQLYYLQSPSTKGVMPAEFLDRKTDADGRFEFTKLPADIVWTVNIRPEGYTPRKIYAAGAARPDYDKHPVYSGNFELAFPRPHDVTIQVVHDDTGEPAPKVLVSGPRIEANFIERSDENGLVHMRLPKGTFKFKAAPRYQTPYLATSMDIVIGDDPPYEPFTLRLRPAAIVEVMVTDADTGNPLPGADLWMLHPGSNGGDPYRKAPESESYEIETNVSHHLPPLTDEHGQTRANFEPGRHVIGVGLDTFPVGYVPVDPDGTKIKCVAGKVTQVALQMRREDPAKVQAAAPAAEVREFTRRRFKLQVVDAQGQPVPNADVELRIDPAPSKEHVVLGEFVKESKYGPFARTDAEGRLYFSYAAEPRWFNLSIKTAGYGPYWAEWNSDLHPQAIPVEFTAELEAGWSVGGIVVDELGQPVVGVQVKPNVSYKKRPGDEEHLGIGTRIKTDDAGRWRFDSVPASMSEVWVEVSHPEFAPHRRALTRAEFGLEMDQTPTAAITLPKGLTIAGHVADADGNPIEGALLRTKFSNDIREARSDAEGNYRIPGCESRMTRVVISAPGRATDMQIVRVDPDMPPVDFTMQPGGKLRIRVVDEQGQGIPKARIFLQRWRGMVDYFEFDFKNQYADEHGVWEWNEAPLDEFQADICRPDGMQLRLQKLVARDEEYVFTPSQALVASGSVVDAATKEPIKNFRVTPGVRNENSSIRINWNTSDSYDATDGTYRIRFDSSYPAQVVRIEADGYRVAVSRDIKPEEGETDIDFELQPGVDIAATVVTPDGQPAAGAKVALAMAGMQVQVRNGDMLDSSTYATRRDTATDGSFRFPSRGEPFQLVITHPSGYAWIKAPEQELASTIRLTAWARIEGVFHVGAQPVENVTLRYDSSDLNQYGNELPRVYSFHEVTTGPGGKYVFERVVPGKGRLSRNINLMVNDGATEVTSAVQIPVELPPGQVTTLDLGGNGRAVIGRLSPKSNAEHPVLWNFALINAYVGTPQADYPKPPADVENDETRRQKWWNDWAVSPEGKAYQERQNAIWERRTAGPRLTATVDRDGSFRIDDVPPGEYVLSVRVNSPNRITEHPPGSLDEYAITVPAGDDLVNAAPLDLGVLQLE